MDEMKIESKFMRGIISRIIRRAVKKKTGCDVDIQLKGFRISNNDDLMNLHLEIDGEIKRDELSKIIKMIGVDD